MKKILLLLAVAAFSTLGAQTKVTMTPKEMEKHMKEVQKSKDKGESIWDWDTVYNNGIPYCIIYEVEKGFLHHNDYSVRSLAGKELIYVQYGTYTDMNAPHAPNVAPPTYGYFLYIFTGTNYAAELSMNRVFKELVRNKLIDNGTTINAAAESQFIAQNPRKYSVNVPLPGFAAAPAQNTTQNSAPAQSTASNSNAAQNSTQSSVQSSTQAPAQNSAPAAATTDDPAASYKSYANYDFVPGDTVLFADDFTDDQDGEFPSHWNLDGGQGILNMVGKDESFAITQGNYALVSLRMKNNNKAYLTSGFTIEFNFYANRGYGPMIRFRGANNNDNLGDMHFGCDGSVNSGYFKKDFGSSFPTSTDDFKNKWHHGAFIYKNGTIKCYIDQYRIIVMPNVEGFSPGWLQFGGIGDQQNPILFKDVRIASGGNMNIIGKKFTDAKIITHGINFDIDKATLKPESMGTLNMIVKIMNNNPDLKFEVDGHTDNSGAAQHNKDLSQQRADAVKAQLVSLGIDGSRLTTKGFGDTKPISTNDTQEGKSNNRRVEFVRE